MISIVNLCVTLKKEEKFNKRKKKSFILFLNSLKLLLQKKVITLFNDIISQVTADIIPYRIIKEISDNYNNFFLAIIIELMLTVCGRL